MEMFEKVRVGSSSATDVWGYSSSKTDFCPVLTDTYALTSPVEFYTTPVPSEDIWKKFDLPDLPMMSSSSSSSYYPSADCIPTSCSSVVGSEHLTINAYDEVMDTSMKSHLNMCEIQHHDCMWAGSCINKEHDQDIQPNTQPHDSVNVSVNEIQVKTEEVKTVRSVKVVKSLLTNQSAVKTKTTTVKKNQRSLLISSRTNVHNSGSNSSSSSNVSAVGCSRPVWEQVSRNNRFHRQSLESDGDSPRPDTPQSSESEDENDSVPRFKHSLSGVFRSSVASNLASQQYCSYSDVHHDCDCAKLSVAVSVSEVTGQVCRSVADNQVISSVPPGFYSDHSYHLKGNVTIHNLGVQTPSDSEEEIDVVSVNENPEGVGSVGLVGSTLPTNPSEHDRQQLQATVATAINQRKTRSRSSSTGSESGRKSIPLRISIGETTVSVRDIPIEPVAETDKKRKCSGRGLNSAAKRTKKDIEKGNQKSVPKGNPRGRQKINSQRGNQKALQKSGKKLIQKTTQKGLQKTSQKAKAIQKVNHRALQKATQKALQKANHKGPKGSRGQKGAQRGGQKPYSRMTHRRSYRYGLIISRARKIGRNSNIPIDETSEQMAKRALHNDMERQRRVDLRNLVQSLRVLVPAVEGNTKAAKVLILREAAAYSHKLRDEAAFLLYHGIALKKRQDKLRARLAQLRFEFAAKR